MSGTQRCAPATLGCPCTQLGPASTQEGFFSSQVSSLGGGGSLAVPVPGDAAPQVPWTPRAGGSTLGRSPSCACHSALNPVGSRKAWSIFKPLPIWTRRDESSLSVFTSCTFLCPFPAFTPLSVPQCRSTFQSLPMVFGAPRSQGSSCCQLNQQESLPFARIHNQTPTGITLPPLLACLQPQQLFHNSHFLKTHIKPKSLLPKSSKTDFMKHPMETKGCLSQKIKM